MRYEIINKTTAETHEVTHVTFGQDNVVVATPIGDVTFSNIGQLGDLQNEEYAIRTVDTHLEADGTGTVEIVPPTE